MATRTSLLPSTLIVGLAIMLAPATGLAQAWVPEPGSISLSVRYDYIESPHHVNKEEFAKDQPGVGRSRYIYTTGASYSNFINLGAEYAPSFVEGLALSLNLPYAITNYEGITPHEHPDPETGEFIPSVDGQEGWYKTWVDLTAEVRYRLLQEPFVLTPLVGVVIPVADYETYGHSVPGRGLQQFFVGANLGLTLEALPGVFANLRYALQFAEPIELVGVGCEPCNRVYRMDLSMTSLTLGYFLGEEAAVSLTFNVGYRHDGIDQGDPALNSPEFIGEINIHDKLLQEFFVQAVVSATFNLTEHVAADFGYRDFVTGYNTHDSHGPTVGVTVSF